MTSCSRYAEGRGNHNPRSQAGFLSSLRVLQDAPTARYIGTERADGNRMDAMLKETSDVSCCHIQVLPLQCEVLPLQCVAMVLNRVARWTHEGIHSATMR